MDRTKPPKPFQNNRQGAQPHQGYQIGGKCEDFVPLKASELPMVLLENSMVLLENSMVLLEDSMMLLENSMLLFEH